MTSPEFSSNAVADPGRSSMGAAHDAAYALDNGVALTGGGLSE
jgi:hypothetical protein